MKVLLTNGSPHRKGCTHRALCEVSEALNENGIDTDMFWIGNHPLGGVSVVKRVKKEISVLLKTVSMIF